MILVFKTTLSRQHSVLTLLSRALAQTHRLGRFVVIEGRLSSILICEDVVICLYGGCVYVNEWVGE